MYLFIDYMYNFPNILLIRHNVFNDFHLNFKRITYLYDKICIPDELIKHFDKFKIV